MADGAVSDLQTSLETAVAERDALAQELFEAGRFSAQLAIARQTLADELATVEGRVRAEAARDVAGARAERDRALAERDQAVADRRRAEAARDDAAAALARVTGSTAWRLTAPARLALIALLGRPRA